MRLRAVSALVAACLFWGVGFPVTKALTLGADHGGRLSSWFIAAYLVGVRFLVAAILIAAKSRAWPTRSELVQGTALGVITGVGMIFQLDGLHYTEASTNAFLTQGYIVFLPLASTVMNRRLPSFRIGVCVALVVVGLAVLARFDLRTLSMGRGEAETLTAAALFTLQILLLDRPRFAENRTLPVSMTMFGTMAVVVCPVLFSTMRSADDFRIPFAAPHTVWCLATLIAFPTLGSFLLMNRFQRLVSATEAGIVYTTEPVFASAFALVVPGFVSWLTGIPYANEVIGARLVFGGTLVVSANVLLSLLDRRPPLAVEGTTSSLDGT